MPLGKLGLSLSGGGFRATAFHLGVLDALERLGLLEQVAVLSTVSGGSFTGAAYALAAARGQDFGQCFAQVHAFLERNRVPAAAIAELRAQGRDGRRKLITAAAEVYDRQLFGSARFAEILDADNHLVDTIINATEFRTGIPFRFRASASPFVKIGNGRVSIPRAAAAELRVADMVAASSCFPGGFEPMVLPDDFSWPGNGSPPTAIQDLEPLPLMDGGITDNQGLGSVRLAEHGREVDLDLLIISDTDNTSGPLYSPPGACRAPGLRLWILALLGLAAALATGASGLALLVDAVLVTAARGPRLADDLLRLWIPGAACTTVGLLLAWLLILLRRGLRQGLPRGLQRPMLAAMGGFGLGELVHLLRVRLTSLAALVSHIFTRRIRRGVFEAAYEDEALRGRIVPCLMSTLAGERTRGPSPSPALVELVTRACQMPTTLWFDSPQQLPDLVVCGQATLVAALSAHLERHPTEGAHELERQLKELWQRLCDDPHALVQQRLEGGG